LQTFLQHLRDVTETLKLEEYGESTLALEQIYDFLYPFIYYFIFSTYL